MSKQPLTDAEYVATLGTRCPVCQGTHFDGGSIDFHGTAGAAAVNASQKIWCMNCGARWIDTYTLTGYTDLDTSACDT